MMGQADGQRRLYYGIQLEDLVPADHPLRWIRPLIDTERIRALCRPLHCPDNGRPSIPPEQLFLALLGGYPVGSETDHGVAVQHGLSVVLWGWTWTRPCGSPRHFPRTGKGGLTSRTSWPNSLTPSAWRWSAGW